MRPDSEHHLVISALTPDRPGVIDELSRVAMEARCSVSDARMTVMGSHFALIACLSGTWDAIAKFEAQLPQLGKRMGLEWISQRTERRQLAAPAMPYTVHLVCLDSPGIVHDISHFFASQDINIEALETNTYPAAHTGSPMFALMMTVNLPADVHIASLREAFMMFCDERNLDAIIEPFKA